MHEWISEFPAAITVCDKDGIILEMNDKAAKSMETARSKDNKVRVCFFMIFSSFIYITKSIVSVYFRGK